MVQECTMIAAPSSMVCSDLGSAGQTYVKETLS